MKAEYINPFLVPAKTVWERELGHCLELDKAESASNQFTTEDITAVIGVSGSLEGNVLYGFSVATARAVATVMLGEPVETFDQLALSALGEIANIITGNAATRLAQAGYNCQISPPVIIEPMGTRFTTTGGPQILVAFTSLLGPFSVRISLQETRIPD